MSSQQPAGGPVISQHEPDKRDGLTPVQRIANRVLGVFIRGVIVAYGLWAVLMFVRSIKS